jgi:predicted NBD/HSP70 family sugar kinase
VDLGQIFRNSAPNIELITIENDAKASALAELLLGKHGTIPNSIIFLSVGYGIGTGIVLDNHILSGSCHAAGEFGHMIIVEGGELCSCGNQGCWEVYASDRATLRRYSLMKGLNLDQTHQLLITDIIARANGGDKTAHHTLAETAKYLGLGIANIVCSIDPEVIIIGGAITQAWNIVHPQIMEIVSRRDFSGSQRSNLILPTSLSGNPALLGAAALSLQKIFADYRIAI